MKLGELKKSLAKYPPDMDDMEILLTIARDNERQIEPLCFVGYLPLQNHECVVLGGLTEVQRMVKAGEIPKPDGYIEPDDSGPHLFG